MTDELDHARAFLDKYPLIDGHNDLPWALRADPYTSGDLSRIDLRTSTRPLQTDIARLRQGGVGGQFWSVYVPSELGVGYARTQLEQIDLARRVIAGYPADLELCLSASDVRVALSHGRIASMLGIEGGHVLEGSLGVLRSYFDLGVRYMTLTHNQNNDLADSATDEPMHGGLSEFGREVVAEMNRLGMLVDLSHVSAATMSDALDASVAPVIFSHSSARAVCNVPRNVPDEILARVASNGGVVMVTFVAGFVSEAAAASLIPAMAEFSRMVRGITDVDRIAQLRSQVVELVQVVAPTIAMVADHVDHIAQVAGHDHVGIGSDYEINKFWPGGLEDVSSYPHLFAELFRRGWTERNLTKLAHTNVMRVMGDAEALAT